MKTIQNLSLLSLLSLCSAAGASSTAFASNPPSLPGKAPTQIPGLKSPGLKGIGLPFVGQFDSVRVDLKKAQAAIAADSRFSNFGRSSAHQLTAGQRGGDLIDGKSLSTVRFRHTYQGLPVIGSQALYHQSATEQTWIESALAEFDLSVKPNLQMSSAIAIVRSQIGEFEPQGEPSLAILPVRVQESEVQDSARLVYRISGLGLVDQNLEPMEAMVDAHSGELISAISKHIRIAPIAIYSAKGQGIDLDRKVLKEQFGGDVEAYLAANKHHCQILMDYSTPELPAKDPLVINVAACKKAFSSAEALLQNPTSQDSALLETISDASARRAASNTQRVLKYYLSAHGRNSFDGKGGEAVSVVHAGVNFANAFWDSVDRIMAYGDGDGVIMDDLTLSVDVSGHEMTHGVVSETAELMYGSESGALNEAIADYFGKLIEGRGTWLMGEGLFLDGTAGIRDLQKPATLEYQNMSGKVKPYPDHYDKREKATVCMAANDNCWVHINSTIFSHGLYRIHQAIGGELAERLVYQTLTQELTETSTLKTAANSMRKACAKSFEKAVCDVVHGEFVAVGL